MIGYYTSIVLDRNDYPSISFYEYRGPKGSEISVRMRTVTFNGKYWEALTVDGDNQSGKFNSMVMDSQGQKHLAYANVSAITAGVRYAFWDIKGKLSRLEIVDDRQQNNTELVGHSLCMAVDKQGNPHLTYLNYSRPTVKYAVRKDGRWSVEPIESLAGAAYPDPVTRSQSTLRGSPMSRYYDPGRGVLRLAHRDHQKWVIETVDGNRSGFTSSLQIDRGVIWITYADEENGGLKVARREIGSADPSPTHGPAPSGPHNE